MNGALALREMGLNLKENYQWVDWYYFFSLKKLIVIN